MCFRKLGLLQRGHGDEKKKIQCFSLSHKSTAFPWETLHSFTKTFAFSCKTVAFSHKMIVFPWGTLCLPTKRLRSFTKLLFFSCKTTLFSYESFYSLTKTFALSCDTNAFPWDTLFALKTFSRNTVVFLCKTIVFPEKRCIRSQKPWNIVFPPTILFSPQGLQVNTKFLRGMLSERMQNDWNTFIPPIAFHEPRGLLSWGICVLFEA